MFSDLSSAEAAEVGVLFEPFSVDQGETLFRHGEEADRFFVVDRGRLEIASRAPGDSRIQLTVVESGGVLGEGALNQVMTRAATARARDGRVRGWALQADVFRGLLRAHRPAALKVLRRLALLLSERIRRILAGCARASGDRDAGGSAETVTGSLPLSPPATIEPWMRDRPMFRSFADDELAALAGRLERRGLDRGALLFRQGDPGDACFFTVAGALRLRLAASPRPLQLGVLGPGHMLGSLSVLDGGRRCAECEVRESGEVLALSRRAFEEIVDAADPFACHLLEAANANLLEAQARADALRARLCLFDRWSGFRTA